MKDGFVNGLLLDGRFEAVAPLNHGSFGMVFLARDTTSGEMVAIKCLLKSPAAPGQSDPIVAGDHLVELNSHDRLGVHSNIVNLVSAFESDAHLYLVLEYCSMGDLYEAIRLGRGPLETQHVRAFMLELINAVEFIHSKGLYHRDIKPENIFLTQDGAMKLGDFGLATADKWSYEPCVGSDRYMAPEQYDPADVGYSPAQADIWAIGICLLNVLFSRNPFITPSESDVLFADFARDRQSLFDIFPSMSQDTFEVLTHSLAVDPSRRSLSALRQALDRVVTFTTDDDLFDDFCTDDRTVVAASANRLPLRTPSIQSPPVEQGGAFPWAKALHMNSPQAARQLSVIPDNDLESDELFPEKGASAWCSAVPVTPSLDSVIDSALGASIQSMTLKEPKPRNAVPQLSESVPVTAPMSTQRAMSAAVFGKDAFSKSWSDLWDEDVEEEHAEADARRRFNERNWSSDSLAQDVVVDGAHDVSAPRAAGGFAFSTEDVSVYDREPLSAKLPVYSPPAKRSVLDKWAVLGHRRRAVNPSVEADQAVQPDRQSRGGDFSRYSSWRKGFVFGGLGAFSGNATKVVSSGVCNKKVGATGSNNNDNGHHMEAELRDRKSRNRDSGVAMQLSDWRKDAGPLHDTYDVEANRFAVSFDDGNDAEWVGGWHDLHL